MSLTATLTAPAAAERPGADRAPAGQGPPSVYLDPCEHTPQGTTPSVADVRELVIDDLFERDKRTVDASAPVHVRFRLCRPLDSAVAPPLRVDLHPRVDTIGGQDTDFAEDPSRWLLFAPPDAGPGWTWELREPRGAGSVVVADGTVDVVGPIDAITELRAMVPAQELRDAGDPDTGSATGLPPLAVRACTNADDCGPGYVALPDGRTGVSGGSGRSDTDYVPEPLHLPVTYPSICQHGPFPRAAAPGPDPATGRTANPAGIAPAQVTVDALTAARLTALGWHRVSTLPGGRAVFRGTPAAVRAVAPEATVGQVALRRASVTPSDPHFLPDGPGGTTGQWSLRRVGATTGWDATTGDEDVLVAVIDSGFDGLHPDLAGRAVAGRDYVPTRLSSPRPLDVTTDTDYGGHGSFVASIIAAATDDGEGMAGLGWRTRLLVARVFDAESCASDAALVDAIDWGVDRGAAAVNLSLGGPEPSDELRDAGDRAAAAGVIAVAAAGNQGRAVNEFPAVYDGYLSVAATGYIDPTSTSEDPLAPYSTRNGGVDIAAPGGSGSGATNVLGACWQDPFVTRGHCRLAGTSFAAPLVAATVALIRSLDPDRTVEGLRQLLDDTAIDLTTCNDCTPGPDIATGAGRLDAGTALTWLASRTETLTPVGADADAVGGSVAASQATFGIAEARTAVLSRDDVFADALAGAPLAGREGPILLTPSAGLDDRTAGELVRVLPRGSTVTLLGGTAALSPQVERDVQALGYATRRLFGQSRIETAIAIADEMFRGPGGQVLVASAAKWPDAVSAGAYAATAGVPLLLARPESAADDRSPGLLDALVSYRPDDVVILGGAAALSATVEQQIAQRVGQPRRVSGSTRNETAARVVTELWRRTDGDAGDRFAIIDGWRSNGWAFGLSASPYAARNFAPLLLIRPGLTMDDPTRLLRDTLGYRLPEPASGTFFGPMNSDAATREFTLRRLGELLGG